MVTTTLTRDEATARAAALSVARYAVSLDLTGGDDTTFRSVTEVAFTCRAAGGETFIELAAAEVHEATLNGVELDLASAYDAGAERLLLSGLRESNVLTVDARMRYSRTGEGLHRFVDPADGEAYTYSQFETYDAHRMYACFDQPDLKATFTFDVTAPAAWQVVTNAPADSESLSESGTAKTVTFEPTPVMSTYITALIAGPYHAARSAHDGIDLGIYCRASLVEFLDSDEIFLITGQGFDFFHRVFDYRYPFGKYDQLFVPEFNAGAMENAGAVTYRDEYLFRAKVTDATRERRAETILHEMAHMWFGDLVTMRWWDDLWLNESFATYMSVLCQVNATRWTDAWTTFANSEKTWALRQDQLPSTHPIAADASDMDAVRDNFDGITYAKGASVLKQLVAWVGQEEFLAGIRSYFRAHEFSNTSLADLLRELERSSGRNLSGWSAQWLETTGVNTLRPRIEVDSSGLYTAFTIEQSAVAEHPTLRDHRVAVGLYDRGADGTITRRDRLELDVSGALTEAPKLVGVRQPDLLLVNDDDLTFAKVRLDERSLETLIGGGIGSISQSLPRALCWNAAWDMLRDAELSPTAYLTLVIAGLPAEADGEIGLLVSLLGQAYSTINLYGRPEARRERSAELAATCLRLLADAAPGSDQQLVFAQHYARSATGAEAVGRIRGWLAGTDVPAGLAVDTELRWSLLTRLAALGEASDADIAAEAERDKTAAGERSAATARAAVPTPAAKEAAWRSTVEEDSLSNRLLTATMAGFVSYDNAELLKPYLTRYFEALPEVYAHRTHETAQSIATALYPSYLSSQAVIDATDAHLATATPSADGGAASGLWRVLAEGRDGVARALRVRAVDTD